MSEYFNSTQFSQKLKQSILCMNFSEYGSFVHKNIRHTNDRNDENYEEKSCTNVLAKNFITTADFSQRPPSMDLCFKA